MKKLILLMFVAVLLVSTVNAVLVNDSHGTLLDAVDTGSTQADGFNFTVSENRVLIWISVHPLNTMKNVSLIYAESGEVIANATADADGNASFQNTSAGVIQLNTTDNGYVVLVGGAGAVNSPYYNNGGAAYPYALSKITILNRARRTDADPPVLTAYSDSLIYAVYGIYTDDVDLVPPQINFTAPTLANTTTTGNTTIFINFSIIESSLKNVTYNWNGTNFSYYDNDLILAFNFDNVSALGENRSLNNTFDISSYKNNGSCMQTGYGVLVGAFCNYTEGRHGRALSFNGTIWVNVSTLPSLGVTQTMWVKNSSDTRWFHVANVSGTQYIDGVTASGRAIPIENASGEVIIGLNYFGLIDEVRLWNKTLTQQEVYQQYIGNLNKFGIQNWTLIVNQSQNATTSLTAGTYTYQGCTADTSDNWNCTEERTVTIDIADVIEPSFSNNQTNATDTAPRYNDIIQLNLTITDDIDLDNVTFAHNQSGVFVNITTINLTGTVTSFTYIWNLSVTMGGGTLGWKVQGADSTNNINVSRVYIVHVVDSVPPQINFTAPTNSDGVTIGNNSFLVNISIVESSLKNITYNWNGTNFSYYDDSLVLMYNFDNVSSLGENDSLFADFSKYENNGTCSGTSCPIWQSSGKYNGAYNFDAIDDYILLDDEGDTFAESMCNDGCSMCVWAKPEFQNNDNWQYIFGRFDTTGAYNLYVLHGVQSATGTITMLMYGQNDTDSISLTAASGATLEAWNYICYVYDGSNTTLGNTMIYNNGVLLAKSPTQIQVNSTYWALGDEDFLLGTTDDSGNKDRFNGTMDEVRIWGRELNSDEIYQQYIANLNKFNDTNWNLYVNQSYNATDGLTDGDYTYQGCAADSLDNWNCTEQKSITIDLPEAPTISITSPRDGDYDNINLSAVFTPNDGNSDPVSCYLYIDGILNASNNSVSLGVSTTLTSVGLVDTQSYSWKISCNDSVLQTNSTARTYNLDTINPLLDIFSPINNSFHNSNFWINVSGTDNNLGRLNYTMFLKSDGSIIQSNETNSSILSYLDLNDTLDITSVADGIYGINYTIADIHTGNPIGHLKHSKKAEGIYLVNDSNIEYNMSVYYRKQNDKITPPPTSYHYMEFNEAETKLLFGFNFTADRAEIYPLFKIITKNTDIIHYPNTDFKGHLTWGDYGTDFEGTLYVNGIERNYAVEIIRISSNEVDVKIIPETEIQNNDFVEYHSQSIFGLNIVKRELTITLDATEPAFSNNLTNTTGTTPKFNDIIQLNLTVTDTNNITQYVLAHNDSGTMTNLSVRTINAIATHTVIENVTVANLVKGDTLGWQVWAKDNTGNINVSGIYILQVQNTVPEQPNILFPDSLNYSDIAYINYSATDVDGDSLTYEIYINATLNTTMTDDNLTDWNASDGFYNLTVTANDGTDSSINSSTVSFYLDSIAPTITNLVNATTDDGTSVFFTNDNIYFNATITDSFVGIRTVILSWNDSNNVWANETATANGNDYSFTQSSSNLASAADKWLAWRYFANDSAGNMQAGTIVNYLVSTLPSTTTSESPAGSLGGSAGARGGGCDVFAQQYKTCYHPSLENGLCTIGCLDNYACTSNYVCVPLEGGVCEQKVKLWDRLKDDCISENGICEDGENPFKNKDCSLRQEVLSCKGDRCIFKEIWLLKILLISLIFMALFYKKDYQIFIIIMGIFIIINFLNPSILTQGATNTQSLVQPITNTQINNPIIIKYGGRLLPSNPLLGFAIFLYISYISLSLIFNKLFPPLKIK